MNVVLKLIRGIPHSAGLLMRMAVVLEGVS